MCTAMLERAHVALRRRTRAQPCRDSSSLSEWRDREVDVASACSSGAPGGGRCDDGVSTCRPGLTDESSGAASRSTSGVTCGISRQTHEAQATRRHASGRGVELTDVDVEIALHLRAEHAEGPTWDAGTGSLWWVDITGERVHCFDPTTSADCSWASPGQPGGVILDTAGEPIVAAPDGLAVLDLTTGTTRPCVPIEHDRPRPGPTMPRSTPAAGCGSARWRTTNAPATLRSTV